MSWFVYIAQNPLSEYYVGISNDVEARIIKHNSGKGSKMARERGPFTLVYTSVPYDNKSVARKREIQVKKWSRAKKEKLISGEWK